MCAGEPFFGAVKVSRPRRTPAAMAASSWLFISGVCSYERPRSVCSLPVARFPARFSPHPATPRTESGPRVTGKASGWLALAAYWLHALRRRICDPIGYGVGWVWPHELSLFALPTAVAPSTACPRCRSRDAGKFRGERIETFCIVHESLALSDI